MTRLVQREDWLQLGRGLLMGGADIIPGVSGGTVALVLGIYDRLVTAISHVDVQLVRHLRQRKWAAAARHVDLRFLVALGCGIGLGILSLASLMHELLANWRSYTLAGFFGLILASSVLVGRLADSRGRSGRLTLLAWGTLGALVAYWLVSQQASEPWPGLGYTFGCGAVAICAMILPGISGAYILLLLGKYEQITGILKNLLHLQITVEEVVTVVVFAAGCMLGLVLFSKLLRWLLERWHAPTTATLCGFMLGSLYKVWPFQADTTPDVVEWSRKMYEPYWPATFDGSVIACVAITVVAAAGVLALDALARSRRRTEP